MMKKIRFVVKRFVPYGIMVWWLKFQYGQRIDMPLMFYPGFAKRLKRLVKFLLPYGIAVKFVKPFVDVQALSSVSGANFTINKTANVKILCTRHVVYVAKLMERVLSRFGKRVEILTDLSAEFDDSAYIVICPQMFNRLPLNYAAFQMEQTVSSRWLTPDYSKVLNAAMPVFDYSLKNIEYWLKDGVPMWRLYYLPIDFLPGMRVSGDCEQYDVAFYGDPTSPRRQEIIHALSGRFSVRIISEVYGKALYEELAKAKVIVNVHYYENAMLETTRIYETLSLGHSVIVSERSSDSYEEKRLDGIVDFVGVGDVDGLCERISYWLENDSMRKSHVESCYRALCLRGNSFDYYFGRFLLAFDVINFDQFYEFASNYINFPSSRVCLSLPESIERRRAFDSECRKDFEVFPGLRHLRGWTGCGLSYKFIMKKAQEQKLPQITVCEDDVGFPEDFDNRLSVISAHLRECNGWDVFQGMMADVGNVHVDSVDRNQGETYIMLNHMISTVYNIYNSSIFKYFAEWDEKNSNPLTNTIDRALEGKHLKVMTTCPFLVIHKEDLASSLWGVANGELYRTMIANSREKLMSMVRELEGCKCGDRGSV